MKIYYGVDRKTLAQVVPAAMISIRTLIQRGNFVPKGLDWFMDSGAFTYLLDQGEFPFTVDQYKKYINRFTPPLWACMDYCCEQKVLESTGLSVQDHQQRTTDNGIELIDTAPGFVMVLQGWEVSDYLHHIDQVRDEGLLTKVIGVGSVCRRNATKEILKVLTAIKDNVPDWVNLHGFGVKTDILRHHEAYRLLGSVDTYAWAYNAQRDYIKGEGYRNFARRRIAKYQERLESIMRDVELSHTLDDF
jgi:hypothetical protein